MDPRRRQERNSKQGFASRHLMDLMNGLRLAITITMIVCPCWVVAASSPWKLSRVLRREKSLCRPLDVYIVLRHRLEIDKNRVNFWAAS
jgi:hypothetical protein